MSLPTLTPKQTQSAVVLPNKVDISAFDASQRTEMIDSFPIGTYSNQDYWFDGTGAADPDQVDLFLSGSAAKWLTHIEN